MKKFKNTFGVTGSTHAINHFAELAVKEGWKEGSRIYDLNSLYFSGNDNKDFESNAFWDHSELPRFINIDTQEGWNKALELMKEVEPEQLYGECLDDALNQFTIGKIYKVKINKDGIRVEADDIGNKNGWSKDKFKLVPESAYLEQEAKKEKKESNNITILQENGVYNIVISKEIKDKVVIKFE